MNDIAEVPSSREDAPAKVNLFLHVGARRPDGYHDLDSLVVFTEFGDEVSLAPAERLALERAGPFVAGLPEDIEGDLCVRALRALCEVAGVPPAYRVSLTKNMPVAAGIGGGSSDAAAVLRALCREHGLAAEDEPVRSVARSLGADVPMCVVSRTARVGGIGEQVAIVANRTPLPILLVNPGVPLETAPVFAAYRDAGRAPEPPGTMPPPDRREAFLEWLSATRNDLTQAACGLCPEIASVLAALEASENCRLARMSGSGPTCFGVFDSAPACARAGEAIGRTHPDWGVWPTRTLAVEAE